MLLACSAGFASFLDRIMDAWMWMYGSQARDQEAGHPSHHRSPIDPVLDSKLSTNPVVDIIRFLTPGCDFCESLHQSEAIHAHAPGSRDHLALAQCARSGNGGAGKWWRTGTGVVLAGRGIHGTNYCTVRTTPAGFQDSDEPPPRFNTGLHSRQPASSRALSLASHLSLRQHFSTLTGYLHKLFCISVLSSNQNPQMPFSSFHTPSTARRLNPTQPNPSFSLSAAILVICLKLRVLG